MRGNAPRAPIERGAAGLPLLLPVWVVHFPKTKTSRRPPKVACNIGRLGCNRA